jgi:hypothetical protein
MSQTFMKPSARMSTMSFLLITYGVLRGYLRHPLWFMLSTLAGLPKFKRGIARDFSKKWVDSAAIAAWMYIRLKEKIGAEKAFELLRAAFLPSALAAFGINFRTVESLRTFEDLIRFHELSLQGLFSNAKEEVIEHTDSRFEYRCTSCGYVDLFKYLGIAELAPMFCSADNAFYNCYLPNKVTFSRGGPTNTLAEGAPYCTFIYENHS